MFINRWILFIFILSTPLFGSQFNEQARKYYCCPEQIELSDSIILIHYQSGIIEIDTLHADQGGLYFLEETVRCINCRRPIYQLDSCQNFICTVCKSDYRTARQPK